MPTVLGMEQQTTSPMLTPDIPTPKYTVLYKTGDFENRRLSLGDTVVLGLLLATYFSCCSRLSGCLLLAVNHHGFVGWKLLCDIECKSSCSVVISVLYASSSNHFNNGW